MPSNSARSTAIQAITNYRPSNAPLNFVDTKPQDIFGCNVFNDKVMRERLPRAIYKSLRKTIEFGERMDSGIADTVAAVMKDWAIEKGSAICKTPGLLPRCECFTFEGKIKPKRLL